jgi:putative transposase
MLVLLLVALLLVIAAVRLRVLRQRRRGRRPLKSGAPQRAFSRKKPKWVVSEVIRLCAHMPHEGCRKIASTFNRLHRHKNESVGKTYVATLAKRRALAILDLRKKLKNRVTKEGPRNLTWAADLTFLPDSLPAFGIIDHGTRALISLRAVPTRTMIALLRVVLDAVESFGAPRFLRTDNEAVFASPLFTLALRLVGIRHQRTDRFCPWQNGRIERVFWTLKQRLILWWSDVGVPENPQADLDVVRVWYSHVRPHQALRGRTPFESWNPYTRGQLRHFCAWNGLLSGFGRTT